MNHLRENPVGVDKKINALQKKLYNRLSEIGSINGFSRAYQNTYKDGRSLEVYTGKDDKYRDVLRDKDSRFFFYLDPYIETADEIKANVGIVFMVDLEDFYGNSTERKDENFRNEVYDVVRSSVFKNKSIHITTKKLETLLRKAFSNTAEVPYKGIDFEDMHPLHVFIVETEVTYNINICN